tara:strand:- start:381 stop:644 length:264 start_codon:yes stop_codon:yes gene_type:complete
MAKKTITRQEFDDFKDEVKQEFLITRRTIVKTSQKTDPQSIRRKVVKEEKKIKHEKYLRGRYPSVNEAYKTYKEAYKHYKFLLKTVE